MERPSLSLLVGVTTYKLLSPPCMALFSEFFPNIASFGGKSRILFNTFTLFEGTLAGISAQYLLTVSKVGGNWPSELKNSMAEYATTRANVSAQLRSSREEKTYRDEYLSFENRSSLYTPSGQTLY